MVRRMQLGDSYDVHDDFMDDPMNDSPKRGPAPPKGLTKLTYTRLWNTGNFENQKFEASMMMFEGEDPDEKFEQLRKWVDSHAVARM